MKNLFVILFLCVSQALWSQTIIRPIAGLTMPFDDHYEFIGTPAISYMIGAEIKHEFANRVFVSLRASQVDLRFHDSRRHLDGEVLHESYIPFHIHLGKTWNAFILGIGFEPALWKRVDQYEFLRSYCTGKAGFRWDSFEIGAKLALSLHHDNYFAAYVAYDLFEFK